MLDDFSYIEIYIANLKQDLLCYEETFGFSSIGKEKIVSNQQEAISIYLKQKNVNLILTSPIDLKNEIALHINTHGNSVKDVAFWVNNVEEVINRALGNGAKIVMSPSSVEAYNGSIKIAKIAAFGNVIHTLLESADTRDRFFLDAYHGISDFATVTKVSLFEKIDHIAVCIEQGSMQHWVNFYEQAFGLKESYQEIVNTGKSGMNSKVLESTKGKVKIVLMEPMENYQQSQIEEFIKYNQGPGIQHVAFETHDIVDTVVRLKKNGVNFLKVPHSYYDLRLSELPELEEKINFIKEFNILVDKDQNGYLYQIFTQPIHSRPTLFFEFIQRKGAKGFGSNNIKALFKAIELEQEKRGSI